MAYEDIYNPDTNRYQSDFSSSLATAPPLSINPMTAYYGGYMDKGDLQASTSTLREVAGTLRNVLGQFTGAISSTLGTLRNLYASHARPQEVRQPIVQPNISMESGRYIGSATYFESARGALTGRPGSPYILKSDYQQLMSEDFAKRSILLGGSVAGVATEIGAGWLGSKMLGPTIGKGLFGSLAGGLAGFMGGGYVASRVMGRINQGMEFDSLLKDASSRLGVNEGGALSRGFGSSTRRKIAREFRGGDLKMGDYADIIEYGTEYGLFQGMTTPEQFTETVKSAAKQIKVLMKVLRETDVRDAIKDVATFRQWGVPQGQTISFAMHADAVGRAVGLTSQGVMGHMAAGAQWAQQRGMLGATGARIVSSGFLMGRAIQEAGVMSDEDVIRYGGAEALGQRASAGLAEMAAKPHTQFLQMALSKKGADGKYALDEDAYNKFMSGKMSLYDIQLEAGRKVRQDPRMYKEIMKDPVRWRSETIMPDEAKWRGTLLQQKKQLTAAFMKAGRMSEKDAESWAVESMVVSSEDEKWFKSLDAAEPSIGKAERKVASDTRLTEAKEAARGKQGLSAKWKSLKDAAWGYTIGGFDKLVDTYVVDPALGTKDTIARKADDYYNQKWLGLHISTMPDAMPEGYTSPGQLSRGAGSRVEDMVSKTRSRAGKAKTKEGAASVIADEIKAEIEGFGSTKWSRGGRLGGADLAGVIKSPGEKLLDMGAYEHTQALMTAEAAVLGGKKDDLKKLSEKYKLNPADSKKAEELYDVLQELLKQKKITEEMLIEHNKKVLGLYKELEKTGVGQSGAAYATQQSDYPFEDATPRANRWQPRTDDRMNPLQPVDRMVEPRWQAVRRKQSLEERAARQARRIETEERLRLATLSPEEVEALPKSLSTTRQKLDEHEHGWLFSPADADIYGMRDITKPPRSTRVETPDPDKVYPKTSRLSRWDTRAGRELPVEPKDKPLPHRGSRPEKRGLRKADHKGQMTKLGEDGATEWGIFDFDEQIPDDWMARITGSGERDALSQHTNFGAWKTRWSAIDYDDIIRPTAKSKFGYGSATPPTNSRSPDINAPDAGLGAESPGAAEASKALGAPHGGLAQNAEKTSKNLEKVNKGLDGFLTRLNKTFLHATRNSNY